MAKKSHDETVLDTLVADWWASYTDLTFEDASRLVRFGQRVRRASWKETLFVEGRHSLDRLHLRKIDTSGDLNSLDHWKPDVEDACATDWRVVGNPVSGGGWGHGQAQLFLAARIALNGGRLLVKRPCGHEFEINVQGRTVTECPLGGYRIDVGVLDVVGNLACGLEIKGTSGVSGSKARQLGQLLPLYEIAKNAVFHTPIRAVQVAGLPCDTCQDTEQPQTKSRNKGKTRVVTVRLPETLIEQVEWLARQQGTTRTDLVEALLSALVEGRLSAFGSSELPESPSLGAHPKCPAEVSLGYSHD